MNHATTVSESFNNFVQFVAFGNNGIITENTRDQQRKVIKYGHLVANALIFMNVHDQSAIMNDLMQEWQVITSDIAQEMNPYRIAHINRFGTYPFDETRECPTINYDLQVISPC